GAADSVAADASELVASAIESGFLAAPRFVKASGLSPEQRALIAAGADRWHSFWSEAHEHHRAHAIYTRVYPSGYPKHDDWFGREVISRRLSDQMSSRTPGGWNTELAERARLFHQHSEEIARSGDWKEKAFIFYSVAEAPTTLRVRLE